MEQTQQKIENLIYQLNKKNNKEKITKTITTTTEVYPYDELTEKAQEKTLESLWEINTRHEWWAYIYDEAENTDLKINSFNEYNITGDFILDV